MKSHIVSTLSQLFFPLLLRRPGSLAPVVVALGLIIPSIPQANAEEYSCAEKIQECFSLSDVQRDICFQGTSRLDPCRDTPEGALAARRSTFSSLFSLETQEDESTSAPEPMIFDKECVANFDSLWLSHLVNQDHSPETCDNLLGTLNECSRQTTFELLRP